MFIGLGTVIGIMGPRFILSRIRKRFNADVQRGTPDAIDLLVVCSQAGLGFETAIVRVSEEMKRSNLAMAKVLDALLDDLRVLSPAEAFEKLGQRSTTDGLRRLATMTSQSLKYGTALTHVLRNIAEELRRERIIKLEERAHKLSVKLIIPMVLFLMPAMFVILGGSSFLHLVHAFGHHAAP
jgi:tight adherence protein C